MSEVGVNGALNVVEYAAAEQRELEMPAIFLGNTQFHEETA